MRVFLLLIALLAAPLLQAQATLSVNPSQPRVDGVTTVTLGGVVPFAVTWDFGDGTPAAAGGAVTTHAFGAAGSFIIRATYTLSPIAGIPATVQRVVRVAEPRRIRSAPAGPRAGELITLQGQAFFAAFGIAWNFGDGSAPVISDTTITAHVFPRPGVYLVSATDPGGATSRVIQSPVVVGATGPSAPFAISYLALRWEDGTVQRTVNQGDRDLMAYADLKYEGTGLFQAQWLVDGVPFRSLSQQLTFANHLTLASGQTAQGGPRLSLPTNAPGEHRVTLQILQPGLAFEVPVLRYFVNLGPDPDGPVLMGVSPRRVRAGEEVELQLSGLRLNAGMALHLGHDMGAVGPVRMLGPEAALVTVFIAPSARPGPRILRSSKERGGPAGSARLEILPPRQKRPTRK